MSKRTTIFALLAIVVVAALLVLRWVASQPPAGRPNITITFLGYTNNSSGTNLAVIAIANHNPTPVQRIGINLQLLAADGSDPHLPSISLRIPATNLPAGAVETLFIPPPAGQSPWILRAMVYPDVGTSRTIKTTAFYLLLKIGMHLNYQTMPYGFQSPQINPPPALAHDESKPFRSGESSSEN
ncbi:MAG TPA: hypothetical protein VK731_05460 [Candidatus Cybelea sp.]|nr:hypothetical protein [Candidatus Cybelea sp.]